ncbi:methyltransferase family protein [Mesocricetibacter intestinalis]|uniref:Methyltransferase family protein n=1 Tax=Mesocricetibacter intestinalis TaxID=1521930 RepID=A0A4R6VE33_9PAST|nr:methyltransferase domain-containing protein [Mesocricetibacter intestinalis]TDQ59004.1 methyltransferase family protein [Mesocricetibacter intestinalis]
MKTIDDTDFSQLYHNHIKLCARKPKQALDWDDKARQLQTRNTDLNQDYIRRFLAAMDFSRNDSLLDVGCGGGAIALSLAPQVKQVYALDYSRAMLDLLTQRAKALNIENVTTLHCAWEDNWDHIPQCDICVSSRSSMVGDLQSALDKLNSKAKKAVYMTMRVDKDFSLRRLLRQIGRDKIAFPSYIYAVNMLYQQGYRVNVNFIEDATPNKPLELSSEDFIQSVKSLVDSELNEWEIHKLQDYYRTHSQSLSRSPRQHWALLSWRK